MYKIVITLCLAIPTIANAWELDLLKAMQISLNKTIEETIRHVEIEYNIAEKKVDLISSQLISNDFFSLESANESEKSPPLDSSQSEDDNVLVLANECPKFLQKHFSVKKEKRACSKFQLDLISSYKELLSYKFRTMLNTFAEYQTQSTLCDKHATNIVDNMIDARCVRMLEQDISKIETEINKSFSTVIQNVLKIQDTWVTNVFQCMTNGEEPTIILDFFQACKSQIDKTYDVKQLNER